MPGRLRSRAGQAALLFFGSFVSVALLSVVAMVSGTPFVFPSIGPTAFLLLFARRAPQSTPWRTLVGHAIGICCGYGSLVVTGLVHAPSAMQETIGWPRVLAAALSLASTGGGMALLDAFHAPAGATTLIVALGIIKKPFHLFVIEVAVVLLVGIDRLIDRMEKRLRLIR